MRGEWEAKICGADYFGTGTKDGRQILLRFREIKYLKCLRLVILRPHDDDQEKVRRCREDGRRMWGKKMIPRFSPKMRGKKLRPRFEPVLRFFNEYIITAMPLFVRKIMVAKIAINLSYFFSTCNGC